MKRSVAILIAMGPLAIAPVALANGSGGGIAGSPHDFTDDAPMVESWNFRGEICRVCHVPHDHDRNAAIGGLGLLWNHEVTSQTYNMYAEDSHIMWIDGAADTEPTGTTKMCLGCHDGTVGLDQYDNQTGIVGTVFISDYHAGFQVPGAVLPGDLSNTHPLGVVYDPALDTGLNPLTDLMGGSGTIGDVLETGNKVACMSCHDVHDEPGESVPGTHLLRVTTKLPTPSALCLTCHIK